MSADGIEENLVRDPVCGMQIEKTKSSAQVTFKGQTYFMCSLICKDKFVQDPKKFVDVKRGL